MKKIVLVLCAAAVLAGCAGTGEKKPEETAFFPALPQSPKLQFLTAITTEEDIGGAASSGGLKEWLVGGRQAKKMIARPQDFGAVKGRIYILDRTFRKILFIDLAKKTLNQIEDQKEGAIGDPMGLWVSEDDVKYIADTGRKQILVFDKDNQFVRAYGETDQFDRPADVAVYQDKLYVIEFKKSVVQVVDKTSGKTIQTIGKPGGEDGEFNRPTHVTVDREGNIYVNDSFNFRIQKFDPSGKYLKQYGYQGDTLGGFARPKGIDVDRDGFVYVVDGAFENAQIFDQKSTDLVMFFGGYGPHTGSMYLPSGLHLDYDNVDYFKQYVDPNFKVDYLVYVGNLLGDHKVNVYGFGNWIGKPLPPVEIKPMAAEPDKQGGLGRAIDPDKEDSANIK